MKKEQFRILSFGGKVKYILKKYGWEAVFAVYLVSLLGSWIYLDYVAEQPLLSVEMIDASLDAPESEAFESFMEGVGYGCDDRKVTVSKDIRLDRKFGELPVDPIPMLICKVNACSTDVYFWDDQHMEEALARWDLIDLRTILPIEVLERCGDRLIYTGPLLEGGYPCAIHLENCPWIEEHGFYEDCAVGISRNVQDRALVTAFIDYLI